MSNTRYFFLIVQTKVLLVTWHSIYFSLQVKFEINVTANECPKKGQNETIKIKPLGFTEEVEINLQFICECQCQSEGEPNSPACHEGNGTFECGACR